MVTEFPKFKPFNKSKLRLVLERMQWSFIGIPQKQMTVLLDTSDKDSLHSHCYQVNDCQKNNFVNKRMLEFLY